MNPTAFQISGFLPRLQERAGGRFRVEEAMGDLTGHRSMAGSTRPNSGPQLPDFCKIALLAHSIQLLRGQEEGRERDNWMEAAAFWRKQLSNPLSAIPRIRRR